ncbi:MAG: hypothetical protein GY820_30805, partial [Gammaproteobacteria bacterium]|nr:hypothetical protein [Gammaproteobacteria bacterium]
NSVWTGISDARHDCAYRIDQTIREDPMTVDEKEKLESTPARYILPPQQLFYPTDSPGDRTDWWCEITAQSILEATTDINNSAEKYSKREKEQGRISALEDHVVEVALAHGGQVHKLSEEEMSEIDILRVNEAEARLSRQSNQPSTSKSQTGTTKNVPQNMDTSEKKEGFPPLKGATASTTETVPQGRRSSEKSSRASSTESRSSGKGILAAIKEKFGQKPQLPILQLKADVAPKGKQPVPGIISPKDPHEIAKPILVKPIPPVPPIVVKIFPKPTDSTQPKQTKSAKKKAKDQSKPIETKPISTE